MRPFDSFSTLAIHGLCIVSQTFDCGAMKVWNFSVTVCWAIAARPGAPSMAAAAPWMSERRFIGNAPWTGDTSSFGQTVGVFAGDFPYPTKRRTQSEIGGKR